MPIRTRQMTTPGMDAAQYQLEMARALQQRAMTPNLPPMGGPVQAKYGMGQGLVDLANALASSWNVGRAQKAYTRAQEAQAAEQQRAQQEALQAMIGGQMAGDGMGPPTPTPSYEQTVGLSQQAINAGVAPEIARALIEQRKPKAPERIDAGDRILLVQGGNVVGEIPKGATPDAALREQGESYRWGTPSANTQMTVGATLRGQDVGAATQRRGQDMTYAAAIRGQDMTADTARRGQLPAGYAWQSDGSMAPIAGGPAAAAAAKAQNEARQTSPDAVWNMYQTARDGAMNALSKTDTGPIVGRIPAFTAAQQTAQGGVSAMAPVLKQLFRVAGEGVFTDRDQALLLEMVPDRTDRPEAREAKMANIDAIVRAKLGLPQEAQDQTGGASGSWDDPNLDALMQLYGDR